MSKTIFGHPVGLSTLFFTEMWERFSYYGGRAMLFLYMTAAVVGENPGLEMTVIEAGAVYALYTSVVYLTNLPGGWIADRFIGARNAVFYGGCIIALGNLLLAVSSHESSFYSGLALIAIGTGLLKPNVSTMVGSLYDKGDARRDSGFSIFYMGINLGAFLAPIIAGYFGQRVDWNIGFLVVALGMVIGLVQFKLGAKHLGDVGKFVPRERVVKEYMVIQDFQRFEKWVLMFLALIVILLVPQFVQVILTLFKGFKFTIVTASNIVLAALIIIPIVYFGKLLLAGGFNSEEKKRIVAIIVFYLAAAVFWSVFEQAGSTLNLFADRFTDNRIIGWEFPSTWWQSVNALFIIALAPLFAWAWIRLHKAGKEPSTPMKFAIGLLLVGVGFLVLVPAAMRLEAGTAKVGISWLLMTYFIHTVGELFLSPVGLSAMTKLAPERIVGQMMGIWFLGASLGNFIGGRVGGLFETFPLQQIFLAVFGTSLVAALVMFFLVPWMKRLMGDTK